MNQLLTHTSLKTLRPRQNGRHFPDDIFKCIFLNENVSMSIKIWLKFVPKGPIKNISALVQIMAWRRPCDKPLSEPMMFSLLTHICVTGPQWVNTSLNLSSLRQNCCYFADDIFKCIFMDENLCISIQIPLQFVTMCPIDNKSAFVKIMAWRRPGRQCSRKNIGLHTGLATVQCEAVIYVTSTACILTDPCQHISMYSAMKYASATVVQDRGFGVHVTHWDRVTHMRQ